ncbi:uncharacterized protein [Canis lupus baileyi]|uniref:uncharacterized protein isoform X4 n=1 Tax=Canis lupus baileyi TaxID=143281 RepID=UPI003B97388D
MASSSTPGGPLPRAPRRRRLVLTASQKGALQAFFQKNPYPSITAREHLARELAISESRIQCRGSLRMGPLVRRMTPVSSVFLVSQSVLSSLQGTSAGAASSAHADDQRRNDSCPHAVCCLVPKPENETAKAEPPTGLQNSPRRRATEWKGTASRSSPEGRQEKTDIHFCIPNQYPPSSL